MKALFLWNMRCSYTSTHLLFTKKNAAKFLKICSSSSSEASAQHLNASCFYRRVVFHHCQSHVAQQVAGSDLRSTSRKSPVDRSYGLNYALVNQSKLCDSEMFFVLFLFDHSLDDSRKHIWRKTGATENIKTSSQVTSMNFWVFSRTLNSSMLSSQMRRICPKMAAEKNKKKDVTTRGGHGIGDFQPGQRTPCFLGFYQWFCGPLGCESPPTESRFASLDGHKILPFWGPRALAPALLLGDGEVGLTKCTSKKYWYCDNGWWKKSGCNQLRWYK